MPRIHCPVTMTQSVVTSLDLAARQSVRCALARSRRAESACLPSWISMRDPLGPAQSGMCIPNPNRRQVRTCSVGLASRSSKRPRLFCQHGPHTGPLGTVARTMHTPIQTTTPRYQKPRIRHYPSGISLDKLDATTPPPEARPSYYGCPPLDPASGTPPPTHFLARVLHTPTSEQECPESPPFHALRFAPRSQNPPLPLIDKSAVTLRHAAQAAFGSQLGRWQECFALEHQPATIMKNAIPNHPGVEACGKRSSERRELCAAGIRLRFIPPRHAPLVSDTIHTTVAGECKPAFQASIAQLADLFCIARPYARVNSVTNT